MTTEINDKIHELRNQIAKEIAKHIIMSLLRNGIVLTEQFRNKIHHMVDQATEINLK